jgi:hypothetical protein
MKLRRAVGVAVPGLLATALVVGAAALPASAQTYQDTALSGSAVADSTFAGVGLGAMTSADQKHIDLSGKHVTFSLHGSVPSGVTLSGSVLSYTGAPVQSPNPIAVDATDPHGNAEALIIPISLLQNAIITQGPAITIVSLSGLKDANVAGDVDFSATSSQNGDTIGFGQSNLPAGLSSGNTLTYVGGTAAPGTYDGVVVTATDTYGAALNGTFSLTVQANAVGGTSPYGNEVNKFGNGFDSFRQHQYAGAIIAGWPATQHDPATHFLQNTGTHPGAFQFEYAPNGSGTGLCVSDPGGGWSSDPLRDGLILTYCNSGPWQQFIPQSNGTLKNVATGLYVNPDGTGAQLRGGTTVTPWGGSSYTWTNYTSLPS